MNSKMYTEGDIVTVEKANGYQDEALLVRCHNGYASAVFLFEKPQYENNVRIISRQEMYFDAGKLCYVRYDNITDLVKSMPPEEYDQARGHILVALGLDDLIDRNPPEQTPDKAQAELPTLEEIADQVERAAIAGVTQQMSFLSEKLFGNQENGYSVAQYMRMEAERDIYRDLYKELLGSR